MTKWNTDRTSVKRKQIK